LERDLPAARACSRTMLLRHQLHHPASPLGLLKMVALKLTQRPCSPPSRPLHPLTIPWLREAL
jgi:hypothetical protein